MSEWSFLRVGEKQQFVRSIIVNRQNLLAALQRILQARTEVEYTLKANLPPDEALAGLLRYIEERVCLYFDDEGVEDYPEIRERVEEILGDLYAKRKRLVINAPRPAQNGLRLEVLSAPPAPPAAKPKKSFWRRANLREEIVPVSAEEYSEVLVVALFAPDPQLLFRVRGFLQAETSSEYVRYNASKKPHHLSVYKQALRHMHRQEHLPLSSPCIVQRARSNYELMRSDLLQQMKCYTREMKRALPATVAALCVEDEMYRQALVGLETEQAAVIERKLAHIDTLQAEVGDLYAELDSLRTLATNTLSKAG